MDERAPGAPRARLPYEPGSGKGLALVAFLAPACLWLEVRAGGRIFASELILIGLLPFLLPARGRMLAAPLPRTFLTLAALWFAAQVLTDLVRETEFRDYARGWARIAFTMLNFCALYLLLHGSRRRLVLFALGLVAGGFLTFRLNPLELADHFPWKFGLGFSTTLLVVLVVQWRPIRRVPFLPALPLLLIGAYSMTVGSRSLAGITLLAAFYVLGQQVLGRRRDLPASRSPGRALALLGAGVVLAGVVLESYDLALERGYVTEDRAAVYRRQAEGEFGALLGGRSEIFASARAVMDSPIIGHGSWARDPDYAARVLDARLLGYDLHVTNRLESDLIPTHSHLMGAWVEAGVMGALCWLWVMWLVFRVLSGLYLVREPLGPLIAFIGFLMLWDIVFSPFGAERRIATAFYIVLMMFARDVLDARVPRDGPGGARLPPRRPPVRERAQARGERPGRAAFVRRRGMEQPPAITAPARPGTSPAAAIAGLPAPRASGRSGTRRTS